MNENPNSFSVSLANLLGYGFSLIVAIMFLRNFFHFAIAYAPFVIGSAFILIVIIKIIARQRIGIPPPAKSDIMPLFSILPIAVFELAYLQIYPIFPQYQSADFFQHANLLRATLSSQSFPISSQVLYFGYLYLLALPLSFSQMTLASLVPLIQIRIEMAVLVAISPLFFYLGSLKLTGSHRIAWITSLLYSLSGFLWFGTVFVSGLYPNFYGVLASLFLITASIGFLRKKVGVSSLFLLSLAIVNAYLSHPTTLFLILPLTFYLLIKSRIDKLFRRGILLSFALLLPPFAGGVAFPDTLRGFLGFLEGGANFQASTWLSSHIPIPSLNFLVAEIGNDYLTLFLILPSVVAFVAITVWKKSSENMMLLAWFFVAMGVAAFASVSWRFSFVALAPLMLMAGCVLGYKVKDAPNDWFKSKLWSPILLMLFVFPVFAPSPYFSTDMNPDQAQIQTRDYKAMAWMAQHYNGSQSALILTDWHFIYSENLKGPPIAYAPNAHVLWYDPQNAYFAGIQHNSTWMVWTKHIEGVPGYGIFIPDCQKPFDILLTTNTTQTQINHTIAFEIASTPKLDLQGHLVVGNDTVPIGLNNGTGKVELSFNEIGNYTVFAQFRNVVTDSFVLNIGNNTSYQKASVSVPDDYCLPWKLFNSLSLPGGHLVYQNENVKIWSLLKK